MIIYGTRSVKIAAENLFNIECSSCKKRSSTELYVFSKHVHLFWVPMFPFGKTGVAQCENCKKVTPKKEMNSELLEKYNALKVTGKPKFWQFTGLAFVAVLVFLTSKAITEENKLEKEYLAAPQVGDRYYIKAESGYFTAYKIVSVDKDSIEFTLNLKEVNKIRGVADIDKPENYPGLTQKFSRKQVETMYQSEEIPDIIRK